MKKWLIGSIVGAILVFGWQGLSWMMLGIHDNAGKYHPAQDNIISYLSSTITEEGAYMIPSHKPGSSQKEKNELMKQMEGKPWANIIYHKSFSNNLLMSIIRAFLVDIFLVISLIYLFTRGGGIPIPRRVFAGSVAFGLALFLWGSYMGHIWNALPWDMIKGDLIDSLVAWTLCGIWLAWWLNRGSNKQ